MKFNPVSFTVIEWEINNDTLGLLHELDGIGVSLTAQDSPLFEPILETLKNKKLPVAWLTLKWYFSIVGNDEEEILKYIAEDKYQFAPNSYTDQDIKELIISSYGEFERQYNALREETGIPPGIPSLEQSEFVDLQSETLRILKEKGV